MSTASIANDLHLTYLDVVVSNTPERRLIAMLEEDLVGTVGLQIHPHTSASLRQLYVTPRLRRRGIASELLRVSENLATADCCQALSLILSVQDRDAALPFYRHHGFLIAAAYDDGDLTLVKPLQDSGYRQSTEH